MKIGDKEMVFTRSGIHTGIVTEINGREFKIDGEPKFTYTSKTTKTLIDVWYTPDDIVGSLTKSYFGIPQ